MWLISWQTDSCLRLHAFSRVCAGVCMHVFACVHVCSRARACMPYYQEPFFVTGTMSGGGKSVSKGRMGGKIVQDVGPKDVEKAENEVEAAIVQLEVWYLIFSYLILVILVYLVQLNLLFSLFSISLPIHCHLWLLPFIIILLFQFTFQGFCIIVQWFYFIKLLFLPMLFW